MCFSREWNGWVRLGENWLSPEGAWPHALSPNLVSFSLYGDSDLYLKGAIRNAEIVKDMMPDWQCVFFVGSGKPLEISNRLVDLGSLVIPRREKPSESPMFWRFDACRVPGAERFISRDADSRISKREIKLIEEWVSSKKAMHIIRDHPWHAELMMGGMWGLQLKENLRLFKQILDEFTGPRLGYGADQRFLADQVYTAFAQDSLVHASFNVFESHGSRIKISSDYSFIGEKIDPSIGPDEEQRLALRKHASNPIRRFLLRVNNQVNYVRAKKSQKLTSC